MFFCSMKEHVKYARVQQACVNLFFYIPKHIVYSMDNKTITEIMSYGTKRKTIYNSYGSGTMRGRSSNYVSGKYSAHNNELGMVRKDDIISFINERNFQDEISDAVLPYEEFGIKNDENYESFKTVFKKDFIDYLVTFKAYVNLSKLRFEEKQKFILDKFYYEERDRKANESLLNHVDFFVYIDPCYNSSEASGIGLACVTKWKYGSNEEVIICHMDQRFLNENEVINVQKIIAEDMVLTCIQKVDQSINGELIKMGKPKKKLHFFIAVENNAQQCGAAQIHYELEKLNKRNKKLFRLYLYMSIYQKRELQGYTLGKNKTNIFAVVINFCNKKQVRFSTTISINKNQTASIPNIMEYFKEKCETFIFDTKKRYFTGKICEVESDDLVVSVIMAIHFCRFYSDETQQYKLPTPINPWKKISV